jgi:hypothetical protein
LTTICVCPPNTPKCKNPLLSRKIGRLRMSVNQLPMPGVKSHEFFVLAAVTAMILP